MGVPMIGISDVKRKINKIIFKDACSKIRDTRPVSYVYRDDIRILSQVHHAAVDMYLLAIKSFLYHFTMGSVYVLNDNSLTEDDIALLRQHVPGINIKSISEIDTAGFPAGNTWERLLYNIDLSQDAYVIQIDSDTLTTKPMPDLHQAIEDGRGFIIGNGPAWERPIHVDYLRDLIGNWLHGLTDCHVQVAAESVFADIETFAENKFYLRGCSGFTGLPKNQIGRQQLQAFSRQVIARIGADKWDEWGSEQVACNVMISKTHAPMVLPWVSYQNFGFPSLHIANVRPATLIHFIGTHRFDNCIYRDLATQFIREFDGK